MAAFGFEDNDMCGKEVIFVSLVAVLATFCPADSAELPSRKPTAAKQVTICDRSGEGYIYVPGSQTCMRISGYVEVDTRSKIVTRK